MAQRDDVQNKAYIQERRIPPQNAGRPPSEGPRQGMPKIKQGEILVKQTYWDYEDFMNPNLPNPPKKCYYKVMSKEEFAKRQEICKDLEKTRNSILQQLEKEPCSSSDIDLGKAIEECTDAELSSQPLSLGPSVTSCPPQIQHQQQQQQQQQPPPTPSPQQQPPPTHQYQDQYSPQIRSQQARGGFKGPQQLSSGQDQRYPVPLNQTRRAKSLPPDMTQQQGLLNCYPNNKQAGPDNRPVPPNPQYNIPRSVSGFAQNRPQQQQQQQQQKPIAGQIKQQSTPPGQQKCAPQQQATPLPQHQHQEHQQHGGDAGRTPWPRSQPPPSNTGHQSQPAGNGMRMQQKTSGSKLPVPPPYKGQGGPQPHPGMVGSQSGPRLGPPCPRPSGSVPSACSQPQPRPTAPQYMRPPGPGGRPPAGQNAQRPQPSPSRMGMQRPGQSGPRPSGITQGYAGMMERLSPNRMHGVGPSPVQACQPPCEGGIQRGPPAGPCGYQSHPPPPPQAIGPSAANRRGPPTMGQGQQQPMPCAMPGQQQVGLQRQGGYPPSKSSGQGQMQRPIPAQPHRPMGPPPSVCPPPQQPSSCAQQKQQGPPFLPTNRSSPQMPMQRSPCNVNNVVGESPAQNYYETDEESDAESEISNSVCGEVNYEYSDEGASDDQPQWEPTTYNEEYNEGNVCDNAVRECSSAEENKFEEDGPKMNNNNLQIIIQIPQHQQQQQQQQAQAGQQNEALAGLNNDNCTQYMQGDYCNTVANSAYNDQYCGQDYYDIEEPDMMQFSHQENVC